MRTFQVIVNCTMFSCSFQGLVFKTFETLATFDPDLLAGLIQAGKQALIQLEQKRGVGADMQLRSVFRGIKSVVFVRLRYLRARAIANRSRKLCFLWEILRPSHCLLDKKCFLLTCPGQKYFTLTFLSSKSIPTSINYVIFLSFGEVQCKNHQFMHFQAFILCSHLIRNVGHVFCLYSATPYFTLL